MKTAIKQNMGCRILPLLALGFCLSVHSSKAGTIVFSDGDFDASSWTIQSYSSAGGGGSAARISSGGNPDAYLQVTLSMQAGPGGAVVWAFSNSAVYDPSSQGAIATVGYAEDVMQWGAAQAAGAALLQNGLRYWRFTWTTAAAGWTTNVATPDVDAWGYHLDGTQDNGSNPLNPDFSDNASPITFGFYRNIQGVAGANFSTTSGIDNWTTTVTQVSVPDVSATVTLLGCALVCFALIRRRFVS